MAYSEVVQKVLVDLELLADKDKETILAAIVQQKYEKTLAERLDLSKRNTIGRPSKMQPHITERLLTALRQGGSIDMSCKFAGISHDLFNIWRKKARDYQDTLRQVVQKEAEFLATGQHARLDRHGKPTPSQKAYKMTPYEENIIKKANKDVMDCVELFVLIDQAIAECGVRDLASITKAAQNGAWTAAAFRLSKRFPEDYGAKADEGINVNVNVGFNYVEVNRALPKQVVRKDEERAINLIEQGIIEAGEEPS